MEDRCEKFCALSDSEGFMMYHPDMLPNYNDLKSHITQFAPKLAKYLENSGALEKRTCNNFKAEGLYEAQHYGIKDDRIPSVPSDIFKVDQQENY